MDIRAAAIERVLAADPRRSLEETLAQVMAETQASCTAVFVGRGDASLLGGVGLDQLCLDRVRVAWREDAERLRDGRPSWNGSWCVWPCPSRRGTLLVYLAGVALTLPHVRGAIEGVAGLLEMLAAVEAAAGEAPAALPGDTEKAVDLYLKATPAEAVERRQLAIVLNESEWNIARAARVLGVTRATVYKRMERLGIERLRVWKSEGRGSPATE